MNDSSAGIKLLAAVLGFWVIMRALNRDHSGRTLANYLTGTSGSASAPIPTTTAAAGTAASTQPLTVTAAQVNAATGATGGFKAQPGTNFSVGEEPQIATDLSNLGKSIGQTIIGISGYRTPAQSVAAGGFADDPHTKGKAADIGVGVPTRASAASLSEALLAKFGLWRPFDPTDDPNNAEVNHVELIGQS